MIGYIYVIRSHQTEDVYYGSTKQTLSQRMSGHRRNYTAYINGTGTDNRSSIKILQFKDAYIELVEEVKYDNKLELYAREGFYIRNNNCVNKQIAGRTQKEWQATNYEENKEKEKLRNKKYHDDNKELVKLRRHNYHVENKTLRNEESKIWKEEHKTDFSDYNKKYHEEHKEEINKKRRERRQEIRDNLKEIH